MIQIAFVACNDSELRLLRRLWKFYRFDPDIEYVCYHPEGGEEGFGKVRSIALKGGEKRILSSARIHIIKDRTAVVCLAGPGACRNWSGHALDLYLGDRHNLLELGNGRLQVSEVYGLVDLASARFAVLDLDQAALDEDGCCQGLAVRRIDPSDLQELRENEILLVRDQVFRAAFAPVMRYQHLRFESERLCFDLGWDKRKEEPMELIQRLQTLDQLTLRLASDHKLHWEELLHLMRRRSGSYSFFAEYYDNYMAHVDYEKWVNLILGWYRKFTSRKLKRILELACGTANASEILVFKGFEVDACDASPFMLHQADKKTFKPRLFLSSMTEPPPDGQYDLIFCLFDSINYLTQKTEIKTLLANVKAALAPNGVFIFDISTLMNSLQNFNETISYSTVRDGYIVHNADYDRLTNRQISHLTLFRKGIEGYRKYEERHVQRVYRSFELVELIAASGLTLKGVYSPELRNNLYSKRNTDIDSKYARLFYILVNA